MSVKSKMTAIADRLRAMLGTSDPLTLDGMSAALDAHKEQVVDGFEAVLEMGGTAPSSPIMANMPEAIKSIPKGVTVQSFDGSFTTSNSGGGTVNCGFKPDLVVLYTATGNGYECVAALPISERKTNSTLSTVGRGSGDYDFIYVELKSVTTTGCTVAMALYNESSYGSAYARKTVSYRAIKYTE